MMNMRRILKEGQLFKLDRDNKNDDSANNTNPVQTFQRLQTQQTFENVQGRMAKQMNLQNMQTSMAVVLCGALFCCLTFVLGVGLFYYFFFDTLKPYIPYIPYINQNSDMNYLSEANAQQYFIQNPIYAGQIHYARIPVEYWEQRIQMIKSMGLNTLSVYVFWNFHQIQKGKFDFQSKNKNLPYFLQLAQRSNMTVLLRPGPYVCAQWDFGGLPARLLSIEGMQIRSSNNLFIEQTKLYFEELGKVIKKYVRNKQNPYGPILMLQIQNQPGFFTRQKLYIERLKQTWDQIGINCPFYFDDTQAHLKQYNLEWNNSILGVNFPLYQKQAFNYIGRKSQAAIAGEVYSGWFSQWRDNSRQQVYAKQYQQMFVHQFSSLLTDNKSFSMYMAHGGTNFGLTAGYNMITSYDYFAPINQVGNPTDKYHVFRSIFTNFTNKSLPVIPELIKFQNIKIKQRTSIGSIFDNLGTPLAFQSLESQILPFQSKQLQMFNQGIVVYETQLEGPKKFIFTVIIHDLALVYVDGIKQLTIIRSNDNQEHKQQQLNVNCEEKSCKLQIVVEAMGHMNFGLQMKNDKKGILKFQSTQKKDKISLKWKYYKFNLQNQLQWKNSQKCEQSPCLYYVQLSLQQAKDTYFSLVDMKKGYVWVNGHNLGRYWNVGPQKQIYCPGVWLINGKNKILILDIDI